MASCIVAKTGNHAGLPIKFVADRFGTTAALLSLAISAAALSSAPVLAQGYGYGWWQPAKPRVERKLRQTKRKTPPSVVKNEPAQPVPQPTGPLVLTVSLKAQRVQVFDANGLVTEAPISSGRVGNPTPLGVFTILEKNRIHYSNLYDSAPMPNMHRITWSGVAMHAGVLPGYPASHGCIRLPHSFSAKLFGMTKLGNRVIVSRDPVRPVSIAHDRLFTALPPEADATSASSEPAREQQVADASGTTVGSAPPAAAELETAPATTDAPTQSLTAPPKPTFRELWKAEMARRAAAIPAAEAFKAEATQRVADATKVADDAKAALKSARAEAGKREAAARKADRARVHTERELMAFARKLASDRKLTDEAVAKMAETEDKLEQAITDLTKVSEAADADAKIAAEALKSAEDAAVAAETTRKSTVNELLKANVELKAAIEANEAAKRREAKRKLPVSVLVSRKTQKLYVRQGFEPILEVPVTIENPDRPMGTHVFTALSLKENKTDLTWSVVSIPTPPAKADADKKARDRNAKKDAKPAPAPAPEPQEPQTAQLALDRITIPDEARDQIADVMKPGSSLVVSDYGISNETGKFTDLIVPLR